MNGSKHSPPNIENTVQNIHAVFPPVFSMMQVVSFLQLEQYTFSSKYVSSLCISYLKV